MKGYLKKGTISMRPDGYDGFMDKECIAVCDVLNQLPGVKTEESCCGHCRNQYRIWFKCINPYSLGVISRVFDRRYSGTNIAYSIKMETCDAGKYPMYVYMIESESPYLCQNEMNEDVDIIVENINYWSSKSYADYFGIDEKDIIL